MENIKKEFDDFSKNFLPFVYSKENVSKIFEIALLIKGHILIEDFPGIGKTTIAKAFSRLVGFSFSRIQGTSDTLPQDILGGEVYDFENKNFKIKKGPIFNEVVLIDEINRMHPKTQSAFLQCMEEKRISISGIEYELPSNHIIIATQNPVEYSGTFLLPEAQKDRFACYIKIGYPSDAIQKDIISSGSSHDLDAKIDKLKNAIKKETLENAQELVKRVFIKESITSKLLEFINWTRNEDLFYYGISPRGINLFILAMKANAFLAGRDFVIPEDGIDLVVPFLYHRIFVKDEMTLPSQTQALLQEKYAHFLG